MRKALAIDIGGTNTRLAVVNEAQEIEQVIIKPTITKNKKKFMDNIIEGIREINLDGVEAIGAGVPGVVNRETGTIVDLPNVFVKDIPFCEILEKETGLKTFLRNDAEVACLGESYSKLAKKYSSVFFITISTGLGGALCIDHECQDYVTEVGHTLTEFKGQIVEYSILAGIMFPDFAKLVGEPKLAPKDLFENCRKKSKKHQQILVEWEYLLNKYIRLMIDSYHPEIIVMTGGFMHDKDVFLKDIQKANKDVKIKECYFGTKAGLIGAGLFALNSNKK